MIPNVLEKQFNKIGSNEKRSYRRRETREEKLSRLTEYYGLSHGKGKRKKRSKKRGGSK